MAQENNAPPILKHPHNLEMIPQLVFKDGSDRLKAGIKGTVIHDDGKEYAAVSPSLIVAIDGLQWMVP